MNSQHFPMAVIRDHPRNPRLKWLFAFNPVYPVCP